MLWLLLAEARADGKVLSADETLGTSTAAFSAPPTSSSWQVAWFHDKSCNMPRQYEACKRAARPSLHSQLRLAYNHAHRHLYWGSAESLNSVLMHVWYSVKEYNTPSR